MNSISVMFAQFVEVTINKTIDCDIHLVYMCKSITVLSIMFKCRHSEFPVSQFARVSGLRV